MATGVASWSTTAASNATADSAVGWSEGQAPSTVNDSARGMMASVAKWRDDLSGAITTGGTSTAYTATSNQVFASLTVLDNRILTIVPHATSGAAPTLAVDELTAKAINISTGVAVPTGYLIAGTPYIVYYEAGVGEFIVLGTPGAFNAITGTTGTFSSTLAVTGVATFSAALRAPDGNAAAPAYSYTNDTDCGWYRAGANNLRLAIGGSNIFDIGASGLTVTGIVTATGQITAESFAGNAVATQADQETSTSTSTAVSPGRQQFHPSAAKFWLKAAGAGTLTSSYNITSVTDTGTGVLTVTIATDFSSADYCITTGYASASVIIVVSSQAAGSFALSSVRVADGVAADPTTYYAAGFGDQA